MKSTMLWLAIAGLALGGCASSGSAPPGAVVIRVTEKGFEPAVVTVGAFCFGVQPASTSTRSANTSRASRSAVCTGRRARAGGSSW